MDAMSMKGQVYLNKRRVFRDDAEAGRQKMIQYYAVLLCIRKGE